MKAVIQRVRRASVEVDRHVVGRIEQGMVVMLGVAKGDSAADVEYMAQKLPTIRMFSDEQGKLNRSLTDIDGAILLISQFTLLANLDHGRRPSFEEAAPPQEAELLYRLVADRLRSQGHRVETGIFGASMIVSLDNDGPVTLLLDSRKKERVKNNIKCVEDHADRPAQGSKKSNERGSA